MALNSRSGCQNYLSHLLHVALPKIHEISSQVDVSTHQLLLQADLVSVLRCPRYQFLNLSNQFGVDTPVLLSSLLNMDL